MNTQAKVDLYRKLLRRAKSDASRVALEGIYRNLEQLQAAAADA